MLGAASHLRDTDAPCHRAVEPARPCEVVHGEDHVMDTAGLRNRRDGRRAAAALLRLIDHQRGLRSGAGSRWPRSSRRTLAMTAASIFSPMTKAPSANGLCGVRCSSPTRDRPSVPTAEVHLHDPPMVDALPYSQNPAIVGGGPVTSALLALVFHHSPSLHSDIPLPHSSS